ncbi:tRNA (guanosine(46)-N7)-methyltransferase TrmB [Marinomonas mediterranea]|jgi:tRNA (guanine-N(7)-)-methyltransferase (EC 2.1.1.33)|uniref:tRNA (guanine-N(7)-)-methyltransferase n=1 Tax=Marinomonas mediterranea (strain ATCC 700492 / JCM 21426 / NBRC 103028 / MMB-1) TaxID=717774 RepID=F2K145_MARM1|nr:tRNA (guanosine(46)-N7)-methyltransferase TrmB [Marinomonas mediterranea]ADZ89895.1 tRNA (guanine-N(7)-)-methyltransferase [Marinomonas mediterranea MMB-1]WCN07980.1 tRNA (guanosine(46)-N7)-methyltransferase TrmB [Marinomonas mediterranea]WCN12075.1 tRNA (guanosine(46)-N7)-methyltransferase TrmB [Marinomonas mediterranea]WCN16113.1 tRNA (guanosine(46)-N7)-methyltransferase TrmB [Marinomonas mediterranea MMB-1]
MQDESKDLKKRTIRSFVVRGGRMTEGQQKAYDNNWQIYGLDFENGPIEYKNIFGRESDVVLEVGFGMGASLVEMAKSAPEKDFIGIEVHPPGVAKLMMLAAESGVHNIRVYCHDAIEVIEQCLPKAKASAFQLFFPDPWHKKKHNKRRIVQPIFADQVASTLKTNGQFHMATDWEPYAEHMMEVMEAQSNYDNIAGVGNFHPRPGWRPLTKFEQRGEKLGHGVWDLIYAKK